MSFADPRLLWLALLAPAVAAAASGLWRRRLAADAAWASRTLWDRLLGVYRPRRLALSVAALALAVAGTAVALARPRWGESKEKVERKGVDVVFLLDSSLSMAAQDVPPSRLYVAKTLIRRMAEALPGNRVALVQAEGSGVVLAPLTVDVAVLDLLLDTVEPGSLPTPGTELVPALDTALHLFGEESGKHRVLVVLSDGEDHGGGIDAEVQKLREAGVIVHALGIGTPQGSYITLPDGEIKRDAEGEPVLSRLHEENLEGLARATHGVYLRATSAAADPSPAVARIARMEGRTIEAESVNTREERFQWPLAVAVLALLLYLGVSPFAAAREAGRAA